MEHWHGTCYPASILKIICTIVVVCILVGTFVMFYEEILRLCQVEEDDQTNILQVKLRLQLLGLLPWWQTEHAFGMAHLSELTHCLARIYIPSFEQCKQIRATLARRSSCGTGVAPARQETGVFPDWKMCDKKRKQEKEEGKTFRSERIVNFGPKSQRFYHFWTKKSLSISFPLRLFWACWGADEPQAELCLVFVPWQAQPAPSDTSTFLAVKNRVESGTLGSLFQVEILPNSR